MTKPTSVYIIVSGEFIKIGYAADPVKRVKGIRTGSPQGAQLFHAREFPTLNAARYAEKRMHRQLGRLRNAGEWFRYSPAGARIMLGKIKVPPQDALEANGGYGWRDASIDEVREALDATFNPLGI